MCLQCTVDAVSAGAYSEDFLPGFSLMRSMNDKAPEEWPKGALGLVECNNPTFVITATPVLDICFDMSDDEIENMPDDVYREHDTKFYSQVSVLEENLMCEPINGYKLVKAAMSAGYDPKVHGYRFAGWLLHKLAEYIGTTD